MRLLISIIILAGAVAVFMLFGNPLLSDIKILRAKKAEIETSLNELRELAKVRDDLLSEYNAINPADLARLEKIVPNTIDAGLLIAELEKLAKENEMSLRTIEISEVDPAQTAGKIEGGSFIYKELPIRFQVSGSYHGFRSLLERLEKDTRIIDISNVNFSAGDSDNYLISLDAKTYWTGNR